MFALLVKPTVKKSRSGRQIISELLELGGVELVGSTSTELRTEIDNLRATDPNLVVVACGGDGTVHLAVNSLPDLATSIAVIPLGTGNDFARFLGIKSPREGIAVLSSGRVHDFDFGSIELTSGEQRKFVGVASCGFDAQVNERANTYRGPAGTIKYVIALLVELSKLSARELDIAVAGEANTKAKLTLVAIGNTSSYGGGMKMCPTADAHDGLFEATFVAEVSRRLLLRVLPKVFWGAHVKHPLVTQAVCARIEIAGEAFPVYADGERIGQGPVLIHVVPGGLRVWQATRVKAP